MIPLIKYITWGFGVAVIRASAFEIVGSIHPTKSCEKSVNTLSKVVAGFSPGNPVSFHKES